MAGDDLIRYFRQMFEGDDPAVPEEGSELRVQTAQGDRALRVQDVTNIGIHERADGSRSERFSVILEGDLEIILDNDSYEFRDRRRTYPMALTAFGPEDGRSPQLYEALLEIEE